MEAAVGEVVNGPGFPDEFRAGATALRRSLFGDGVIATPADGRGAPIRVRETALALPGAGRELRAAVARARPRRGATASRLRTRSSSRIGGGAAREHVASPPRRVGR